RCRAAWSWSPLPSRGNVTSTVRSGGARSPATSGNRDPSAPRRKARRGRLQVLLVQRNPEARFMPGVWVFPGGAVDSADGDGEEAPRAAAVRELAEEAAIELGARELVAYSRWIPPKVVPIRFDTRFYLALAPPHSPPEPDGSETVDAGWFRPQDALD